MKKMTNAYSLQVFLFARRAELDVINARREITGMRTGSIDTPVEDAAGFVQFVQYMEGFEQGALFSWPSNLNLALSEADLTEQLASRLNTVVLLESIVKLDAWFVASNNLPAIETKVKYLCDGI